MCGELNECVHIKEHRVLYQHEVAVGGSEGKTRGVGSWIEHILFDAYLVREYGENKPKSRDLVFT